MLVDDVLWDKTGEPRMAVLRPWLITLEGELAGFIERDGAAYTMQGEHRGWYEDGILRDQYGFCLAQSEMASDPRRPPLQKKRVTPSAIPTRAYPVITPLVVFSTRPPVLQSEWSTLELDECFGLARAVAEEEPLVAQEPAPALDEGYADED
jgi:hypothetical protein